MSARIVTTPKGTMITLLRGDKAVFVTEDEASILLEAYAWICRRDDIYQKFASHMDLDDETLLGLNLKVNKFLRDAPAKEESQHRLDGDISKMPDSNICITTHISTWMGKWAEPYHITYMCRKNGRMLWYQDVTKSSYERLKVVFPGLKEKKDGWNIFDRPTKGE